MGRQVNANVPEAGYVSKEQFNNTGSIATSDFAVVADQDNSRKIVFDPSAQSTGKKVTFAAGANSSDIVLTLPTSSGTLSTSAGSGGGGVSATGTLTSAAAATPVIIIADATVGAGKKIYLQSFWITVNGGTDWATTSTLSIQDTSGVEFAQIPIAALTGNAQQMLAPSVGFTFRSPFLLGTGGTTGKGIQVVGNANGTGSDAVITIWGNVR